MNTAIREKLKRYSSFYHIKNILLTILAPVITFYLFEFITHNPFKTLIADAHTLNIVLFELLALFFVAIFGRLRRALMTVTGFFLIVGIANYFVLQFRSAPIMPWDIFSIKTAASVADNFKYTMEKDALLACLGLVALLLAEFFLLEKKKLFRWKIRLSGTAISFFALYAFTVMIHADSSVTRFGLYDKLFTPTTMSYKDGTALAFLMELEFLIVDKPSGYSAKDAQELLETYTTDTSGHPGTNDTLPNIIVIMNEAFSDLSVLDEFETNMDYMPFVRSLITEGENTISGNLHVSVLGGNTANTEFEFLTGNSMAFLPQGSIPYQQYIKSEIPALPSYLKEYGYTTIGMHPYNSTGWERNKIYPMLGLDDNYFIKDFKNPEKIRKYVSDKADYAKIIELFEAKEKGKPLFLFNVTMQNHSSYSEAYDNFTPEIALVNANSSASLDNYLSLIYLSDQAIEQLIQYFEQVDEPTIVVFFGDHQPTNSVVRPIWTLNGKTDTALTEEENASRYEVPYFIWANYDIEEATNQTTSTNFLATKVLDAAGIPLSPYMNYLADLSEEYPVISAIQAVSSDGSAAPIKELEKELLTYKQMQYYHLFDYKMEETR